ncbi:hypothetical protein [Gracilimonas mengyeensis]|uniref:DUF748 domain-containing protein n=1 Tax=Gracilimonas mengyeensis TaxID=1302730 RepID=A0A521EEE0_9BACT|nr:hypothetical protein [Gracilimonas mengyeensis]SMO82268.1 hypothetical protein SAMN06265219_111151 [Gracilimonas mengyeensis]
MKKALKVFLIFVISVIILAVAAAFIAPYFLSDPLEETLSEEFSRQTDQDYSLTFSTFDIGVFTSSISVDSIVVESKDDNLQIRSIEARSFSINGINWFSLISQKIPSFSEIEIQSPRVKLNERTIRASSFEQKSSADSSKIPDLTQFDIIIRDGAGSIVRADSSELFSATGIDLRATQVDLNRLMDGSALLFLEDLDLTGGSLKWSLKETYYELSAEGFHFDKSGQSLNISQLALTPLLPKYEYAKARGRQIDRIQLDIPEIQLSGVNIDSLVSKQLNIDSLIISEPWLEVFRDKHRERATGPGRAKPMLHQASSAIPIALQLNGVRINKGTIIYSEHKPPSDSAGHISFNNLNATLGPFRSATHPNFKNDPLLLHVDTDFMNAGALQVDIRYPFYRTDNYHHITAKLGPIDPKQVNNMLKRVGFVEVESGMVHSLDAEYELTNVASSGEVTVLYDSLKVSFLNKRDPGDENILQKAGNFVANTFLIKSNNGGENPRVGEIDHERNEQKSIFAYWWRSLLSGLKDSIR